MPNGINFDYSNDNDFKTFVVQNLTALSERTKDLADLKKIPLLELEIKDIREGIKDDKFWNNIKAYSGPVMVALHIAAKKIGLNI